MLDDIEKLLNHSWTPTQTLIDKYVDSYACETASLIDHSVDYDSAWTAIKMHTVPSGLSWDSALLLHRLARAWQYLGFTTDEDGELLFSNLCEILHINDDTAQEFKKAQSMAARFTVSPILFVLHLNIRYVKEQRGILTPNPLIPQDFTTLTMDNDRENLEYYFLSLFPEEISQFRLDDMKKKENNE